MLVMKYFEVFSTKLKINNLFLIVNVLLKCLNIPSSFSIVNKTRYTVNTPPNQQQIINITLLYDYKSFKRCFNYIYIEYIIYPPNYILSYVRKKKRLIQHLILQWQKKIAIINKTVWGAFRQTRIYSSDLGFSIGFS